MLLLQAWPRRGSLAIGAGGCHEHAIESQQYPRAEPILPRIMTDPQPFGAHSPAGLSRWVIERTRSLPDGWAARRLVLALRRIGIRALNGAPADVEALGVRMRLYPYNNICEKRVLFTPQLFDPAELEILADRV